MVVLKSARSEIKSEICKRGKENKKGYFMVCLSELQIKDQFLVIR